MSVLILRAIYKHYDIILYLAGKQFWGKYWKKLLHILYSQQWKMILNGRLLWKCLTKNISLAMIVERLDALKLRH